MEQSIELKKPLKNSGSVPLGNETYLKRFLRVLPVSFCFVFTVFLFGPCELAYSDLNNLVFTINDVLIWMGLFSICLCFGMTAFLAFFKGRVFGILISLLFSVTLSSYIEGEFLSSFLPTLDGNDVEWGAMIPYMILDLLLWVGITAIVLFLMCRLRNVWKNGIRFIPILLVVMQLAALFSIAVGAAQTTEQKYTLTKDGIYDFSEEKNIIVFVLDRLDYDYIEKLNAEDPAFFDKFDGFTCYSNAMSEFGRTYPGASFILSGDDEDAYKTLRNEYYDKQWEGDNLLSKLNANGYDVSLYGHTTGLIGTGKNLLGAVSNLSEFKGKINGLILIGNLRKLTLYRYMPLVFKQYFWCYTEEVNANVYPSTEINQTAFNSGDYELNYTSDENCFKFYHFIGSHAPYTLNGDGTKSDEETDVVTQTKGCFNIIYGILEKMKDEGVYKDSAIIILADHGNAVDDKEDLQKATTIGLFYKPSGEEGTPLKYSNAPVSQKNVPATILKEAGIDTDDVSLDEVAEDADVVRYYYKSIVNGRHESSVSVYSVNGDAKEFKNWTKLSEFDVEGNFFY